MARPETRMKGFALFLWLFVVSSLTCFPVYASHIDVAAVIVGDASPQIDRDLAFARRIFEQIDLGIRLESLERSTTLPSDVNDANEGIFLRDATWHRSPFLTIWYVSTTALGGSPVPGVIYKEQVREGCVLGICIIDELRYGLFVSENALNDTFARLIGLALTDLVLGPSDPKNLLSPLAIHEAPLFLRDVYPTGLQLDQITAEQLDLMKTSEFFVPEPSSLLLMVFPLLILAASQVLQDSGQRRLAKGT